MRAQGVIGIVVVSLLISPATSQPLVVPEAIPAEAITSHAVGADDYPPDSIRQQEQGAVGLRFLISETGDVTECSVVTRSGYPRLDEAACVVVHRWKYKPATLDGKATAQTATANVTFQLSAFFTGILPFDPRPDDPEPSVSDPSLDIPGPYVPPPR